jgi:hypothetical protein
MHLRRLSILLLPSCIAVLAAAVSAFLARDWLRDQSSDAGNIDLTVISLPDGIPQKHLAVCGHNCLFMLLRLRGADVSYDKVLGQVPEHPLGASLWELKQGAYRLGVRTRVIRCSLDQLATASSQAPVIVHFLRYHKKVSPTGHYFLVLGVGQERIDCVDGTSGERIQCKIPYFERHWDGYALVPCEPPSSSLWVALAISLLCVVGLMHYGRPWRLFYKEQNATGNALESEFSEV